MDQVMLRRLQWIDRVGYKLIGERGFMDVMQQAMEVFARGFAFTRSFTHPYLPERVGDLWVVRDGPRKKGDFRREEWIAQGVTPRKVV